MARGGLGGCFPGFPSSPTQLRAAGLDGARAPNVWVLRAARARVCVAPERQRWGVGRRWLNPTLFPCPFLPLPPRSWERSGGGRGRGRRGRAVRTA